MSKQAKIWTWVFIIKDNKILIWKRTNTSLWEGTYGLPWWHLDFWETITDCGVRETLEETWLVIHNIDIYGFTEDRDQTRHYITFFMKFTEFQWVVTTPEPDKHKKWEWLTLTEVRKLDKKLFWPLKSFFEKYPTLIYQKYKLCF